MATPAAPSLAEMLVQKTGHIHLGHASGFLIEDV
jgi:hypothetical protein